MKKIFLLAFIMTIPVLTMAKDEIVVYSGGSMQSAEQPESDYVIDEYYIQKSEKKIRKKKEKASEYTYKSANASSSRKKSYIGQQNHDSLAMSSYPDERRVRYSGFFDFGNGFDFLYEGYALSLSTTHGIQIGNYFFMGLGLAYSWLPSAYEYVYNYSYYYQHAINCFFDVRAYCSKKKCIPYFDFKAGTSMILDEGVAPFIEGGFGLILSRHFDIGISCRSDFYREISLQLKLGVRF